LHAKPLINKKIKFLISLDVLTASPSFTAFLMALLFFVKTESNLLSLSQLTDSEMAPGKYPPNYVSI